MQIRRILLVIIVFSSMSLFSLPPGWEIVDTRYDINDGYTDSYYTRIKCADSNNCFIWCNYHAAGGYYFRRTTDGGNSWKDVYKDSSYVNSQDDYKFYPDINEIAYPNEKLFIAVGDSGVIIRTTDKGESWEKFRLDSNVILGKLRMLDENYGIMMSGDYPLPIETIHLLETTDGGETWEEMNFVDDDRIYFVDIDLISRDKIPAIISYRISENWEDAKRKFLIVNNNWETWDTLNIPEYCSFLDFVNEDEGWIAGGYYNSSNLKEMTQEIYYTSNGGKNWIEQRNRPYENDKGFTISGIDMYDKNFGIAKSNEAFLLITTDGGKNWQENQLVNIDYTTGSSYPISSICAASPTTAYAILQGDTVYKYTREISNVNEDDYYMANLHPNPATSEITLSLSEEFISAPEIEIINNLGYEHKPEYQINNNEITIDTSTLSPGVYFLRIRSGGQVETKKFVVVR